MASSQPPENIPVDPLKAIWLIRSREKGKHSFYSILKLDFNSKIYPFMLHQACIQQAGGGFRGPQHFTSFHHQRALLLRVKWHKAGGVERTAMKQCGAVLWLPVSLSQVVSETRPILCIIYLIFLFVSCPDLFIYLFIF